MNADAITALQMDICHHYQQADRLIDFLTHRPDEEARIHRELDAIDRLIARDRAKIQKLAA